MTCQLQSLCGHRCSVHMRLTGTATRLISAPRLPFCGRGPASQVLRTNSPLCHGWLLSSFVLRVEQQQSVPISMRPGRHTCKAASAAVASPAEQTSAASQLLDQLTADSSNQCLLQVSQEGGTATITASRDIPAGKVSNDAQPYFEVTCCMQGLIVGW